MWTRSRVSNGNAGTNRTTTAKYLSTDPRGTNGATQAQKGQKRPKRPTRPTKQRRQGLGQNREFAIAGTWNRCVLTNAGSPRDAFPRDFIRLRLSVIINCSMMPSKGSEGPDSAPRSFFSVPAPIKVLFDKFPLVTYPANDVPQRIPSQRRDNHLFVFTDAAGARHGKPSFNPQCLKWQVCDHPSSL